MKKLFIISSVLFGLVGVFYVTYNLFLKEDNLENGSVPSISSGFKNDEKNIDLNQKKISKVIEGKIDGLSIDETKTKIQYYNEKEKGFWVASFDGSIKNRLSADEFTDLKSVSWNQNKKEALIKMGDSFYHYQLGGERKFLKKSQSLDWIDFGRKIIYTFKDEKNKKTLNIANYDGSNWSEISSLEDDSISIKFIPESAKSSFWLNPDSHLESNMRVVSIGNGQIESIGELRFGADYLWSNDGNKFLRSSVSQKGGSSMILEVCELRGGSCKNLNLPTFVSKCGWSNNNESVYCALPNNLDASSILPNDYINKKIFTQDSFWKINLTSGKKEEVLGKKDIKEDVDVSQIVISPREDFLFFIDRKTGELFRIIL